MTQGVHNVSYSVITSIGKKACLSEQDQSIGSMYYLLMDDGFFTTRVLFMIFF